MKITDRVAAPEGFDPLGVLASLETTARCPICEPAEAAAEMGAR